MKKVLAWAVALALVLSSFTMAFADTKTSSDFKDASQINYTEAVDVMVATGVINGYPDGTFGPQKTVKRSEMAKMIAVMMNGGEDVGDQFKSACPFADSKDHWAAGYIAYCASEHIIDGRSADVFDPEAEVTGTEVAKMALTSLGYDSKTQGYTGDTWAASVLKDAKKAGLFKGLDKSFVPGDPCNRESAAQILFNALKANTVSYKTTTTVDVDGTTITVKSDIDTTGDPLYKDVFDEELELDETAGDDFGNPGHTWTYEDETVGTYSDTADYEFIAEATGTWSDILGEYDEDLAESFDDGDIAIDSVVINGTDGAVASIALGDTVKLYEVDAPEADDQEDPAGDNQETAAAADTYYMAVVEQYVAYQITEVNTEDVTSKQAKKGVTALVTLETKLADYANIEEKEDTKIAGFDANSYVEDAVIAVALKGNDVIGSYVMEELTSGAVTKIKDSTVTIDGTAYDLATKFNALDEKSFTDEAGKLVEDEFTLYDYNGYALASLMTAEAESEEFYGMITDEGWASSGEYWSSDPTEGYTYKLKVLTAEGESKVFTVNKDKVQTIERQVDVPMLVAYSLNEDGEVIKIDPATEVTDGSMSGKEMKTGGVLYGREVAEDVVAFANTGTTADPEWVVYDFDDLEAADQVDIFAYKDKDADLVAIYVDSLEETSKTFGFVTAAKAIKDASGNAYEITAFVEGKEVTYTTVGDEDNSDDYVALTALVDAMGDDFVAEYVEFTFDGDFVKAVSVAKCASVTAVDADFNGADAVFYGPAAGSIYALENVYKVIGVSGNSLNVGTNTDDGNDFQACTGATVFCVKDGKMTTSSLSKIKKDYFVVLMKVNEDSSTWDTVIFSETQPAGSTVINN